MLRILKVITFFCVFIVLIFCLDNADIMIPAWILSLLGVIGFFFMSVYFIKKNKECEYDIYLFEKEHLRKKKMMEEIRGEFMTTAEKNRKIDPPDTKVFLPIGYYSVMLAADIAIGLVMIFK